MTTLQDIQRHVGVKADGVLGPATLGAIAKALGLPRPQVAAPPVSDKRRINAAGLTIVKESEGLVLKAYKCPAGIWTIGYGSTGPHVAPGLVITEAKAEELLLEDLARFEAWVAAHCKPATDNQFSALVSFAFNVGEGALKDSTLRRKHLEGDYLGAAAEFARWDKGGGKVLPGLVKRRQREAQLYRSVA